MMNSNIIMFDRVWPIISPVLLVRCQCWCFFFEALPFKWPNRPRKRLTGRLDALWVFIPTWQRKFHDIFWESRTMYTADQVIIHGDIPLPDWITEGHPPHNSAETWECLQHIWVFLMDVSSFWGSENHIFCLHMLGTSFLLIDWVLKNWVCSN
jgi:hypothetical protein